MPIHTFVVICGKLINVHLTNLSQGSINPFPPAPPARTFFSASLQNIFKIPLYCNQIMLRIFLVQIYNYIAMFYTIHVLSFRFQIHRHFLKSSEVVEISGPDIIKIGMKITKFKYPQNRRLEAPIENF